MVMNEGNGDGDGDEKGHEEKVMLVILALTDFMLGCWRQWWC